VVSSAFNLLLNDSLSYEQAKVSCSEGILRNVVLLVHRYQLNKEHIKMINDHIERNCVPYLKRKYPMTESSDVNKSLDDSVKPTDKTDALENDLLFKSGVVFTYREDGNYNRDIMDFLNWLMKEIDSKSDTSFSGKTVYEEFYNYISSIFENVYNESWMNNRAREHLRAQGDTRVDNSAQDITKLDVADIINEKYAGMVKDYTHYIIGRKISKNVPTYDEEELVEGHLTIKHPAILRILTKWC
jgi:hypothetical protein